MIGNNSSLVDKFEMDGNRVDSYRGSSCSLSLPSNAKHLSGNFCFASKLNDVNLRRILVRVVFPEGFEAIDDVKGTRLVGREGALSGCSKLREVVFPDSISYIGELAFSGCSSLSNVRFPKKVRHLTIGKYAFSHCDSLKKIVIPEGTERIQVGAFNDSGLEAVSLPTTLKSIGDGAFGWMNLKKLSFPIILKQ